MDLPRGAQSNIAKKLGVSRQFVSLVLQGKKQHQGVAEAAGSLMVANAQRTRAARLRQHINTLSDEALTEYLRQLVDVVWQYAYEDESVPSTEVADRLIAAAQSQPTALPSIQ